MAALPGVGNESTVGVLITTTADDGGIKTTQAELTVLGDTAAKAGSSAAASFDNFNKSIHNAGQKMTEVGRSMTAVFTLPIVGIGAAAIKSATDFNQAMTYIRTDAGDTTDNIQQLSNSVLDLAQKSQFSPDELANGLYHLASLGLRGADALNALNTAQQMASVGGADLESTASALGGALVTGIQGVQDYTSAAGVLDATIGAGNMRMQDLVNAIGTGVLPVFKNAGLSITDFGAALATLTDNSQDASAAATHLRMTIALMEAPSQKAAGVMESIGLASNQLAMDMQTKGLIPALTDLKQHLLDTFGTTDEGKQKMAAALTEMFGGGRSSAAIQILIDQLDRVQNKETQISTQSGEFAAKVSEQQQTAAAQFKQAWNSVQVDLIKLGEDIMPEVAHAAQDIAGGINNVSHWFEKLNPQNKQLVVDLALTAAAAGPVLLVFGSMAKSLSTILSLSNLLGGGMLKMGGLLGGLGAETSGLGAIGGEAAGGMLAAFGPAALGVAAIGAAAVGGVLLIKHFADENNNMADMMNTKVSPAVKHYQQLAKDLGYTLTNTGSTVNMLTLAQITQNDSQGMLTAAQKQYKTAVDNNDAAQKTLNATLHDSKASQDDVTTAERNAIAAALDLTIKGSNLSDAEGNWSKNAFNFAAAQNAVRDALSGALGVIAQFGPTALNQVNAIDTFQLHVANAIKTWRDLSVQIQSQLPNIVDLFQGSQGDLNKLQNTASSIDLHLSSALNSAGKLQGAGFSLQGGHATGANFARGGWSMVGENGPEAMYVPQGSVIKTNPQTSSMSSPGGNGIVIQQTNHNYSNFDLTEANRELAWRLSNAI